MIWLGSYMAETCNALLRMPLECIHSYLKSILGNIFLIRDTYHPDICVYVSNDMGIRGYFWKSKGFREQKKL